MSWLLGDYTNFLQVTNTNKNSVSTAQKTQFFWLHTWRRSCLDKQPEFIVRILKITLRDGAVGWGNALQAERMRVRFPMVSLEFSGRAVAPGGFLRNIFWRVNVADNLTTFMCRLSWNLGASTYWNRQGLYRPVMGLLLNYTLIVTHQLAYVLITGN